MPRRGKHYNRRGARHQGAVLIHVERKRMFTAISTLAHSIAPATHRLKPLRVHVRTITHDNGKEFAGHRHLARILYIQACFATPYHTGERGVNENTNGLIRAFFPTGTDFSTNHPAIVAKVERLLNSRSGTSLGIRHIKNHARK
ncbi:MAG: IS30 family transposase [Nitrospirota bacterium]